VCYITCQHSIIKIDLVNRGAKDINLNFVLHVESEYLLCSKVSENCQIDSLVSLISLLFCSWLWSGWPLVQEIFSIQENVPNWRIDIKDFIFKSEADYIKVLILVPTISMFHLIAVILSQAQQKYHLASWQ
jgi:hypothetical protein